MLGGGRGVAQPLLLGLRWCQLRVQVGGCGGWGGRVAGCFCTGCCPLVRCNSPSQATHLRPLSTLRPKRPDVPTPKPSPSPCLSWCYPGHGHLHPPAPNLWALGRPLRGHTGKACTHARCAPTCPYACTPVLVPMCSHPSVLSCDGLVGMNAPVHPMRGHAHAHVR